MCFHPYIYSTAFEVFFSPHSTLERCPWALCILHLYVFLPVVFFFTPGLHDLQWPLYYCVGSSQCSQWLQMYCLIAFSAINIFGCNMLEMQHGKMWQCSGCSLLFWFSIVISYEDFSLPLKKCTLFPPNNFNHSLCPLFSAYNFQLTCKVYFGGCFFP